MSSWTFLHRWYMPFAWMTLATVVSVPVAVYFQLGMQTQTADELGLAYGSSWVVRDEFLATIVVYLLGLGSAVWLFDADGSTRWAAFWATLAGIGRVAMPIALAQMSDVTVGEARHYVDWQSLRVLVWFQDVQMFALGIMLWMAFARFVGSSSTAASHSPHYAEA